MCPIQKVANLIEVRIVIHGRLFGKVSRTRAFPNHPAVISNTKARFLHIRSLIRQQPCIYKENSSHSCTKKPRIY